jgi:hypothetical protein
MRHLLRVLSVVFLACGALALSPLQGGPENKTPADGYTIHVSAPHLVNGHEMGPFHHYCKVHQADPPEIVCLIFDSTDPNATLTQVEYIIAKSQVRPAVSLGDWNTYWHDHAVEIASGRVKVHDLPDDKAKGVADLVATTDGTIFSIEVGPNRIPTGKTSRPQAVGHKPLTAAEYKASGGGTGGPATKPDKKK